MGGCDPESFGGLRLFQWTLLFSLTLVLLSPEAGGDSQTYHLPAIMNIVKTGSLSALRPEQLYRPEAITSYYQRGFEALCALFYQMPFPRLWIVVFKCSAFAAVWFFLWKESGSRMTAWALFALFGSMQFIRSDIGNLKNDLILAVPLVYAAWNVCRQSSGRVADHGLWAVPAACAVAMTIKSSALLYSIPVLLFWGWKYRDRFRLQILVAAALVPAGLCFYWINWLCLGNPLYPFEIHLFGWKLFPGTTDGLFHTTVMTSLDTAFPQMFIRGLLRSAGPGGLMLAVGMLLLIAVKTMRRQLTAPQIRMGFLLTGWVLCWACTPFSDHNTKVIHSQLFSGATIRMLLPVLLLAGLMSSKMIAEWSTKSPQKERTLVWLAGAGTLTNLLWYDAVALLVKPENAFAEFAQATLTFDLRILGGLMVVAALICALAVLSRYRRMAAVAVLAAAFFIGQKTYPENLGYTLRFKQIGQPSSVFTFLKKQSFSCSKVAVHSADESSFFLACVNDWLLPRADRVFYAENLEDSNGADWVIICAKDEFDMINKVRGRNYQVSWDFPDGQIDPAGFDEVYRDCFYRVYRRAVSGAHQTMTKTAVRGTI